MMPIYDNDTHRRGVEATRAAEELRAERDAILERLGQVVNERDDALLRIDQLEAGQ